MFENIILENLIYFIQPEVAVLPPLSSPGVLDYPVLLPTTLLLPVTHQQDGVVSQLANIEVWSSHSSDII